MSYITGDIILITRQVKLIGKKEFIVTALDPKHKVFIIYVVAFSIDSGDKVHPSKKAQIAHLKANEAPTKVLSKYADFANVVLPKLAI